MPNYILAKSAVLGAALLAGSVIAANAGPACRTDMGAAGPIGSCRSPAGQIAALPPAETASRGMPGPRPSSYGTTRSEPYRLPPDYAGNVALHPYTSGLGPRPGPNGTARSANYQPFPGGYNPYTAGLGPWPGPGSKGRVARHPSDYQR